MTYTDEEISKYLNIISSYKEKKTVDNSNCCKEYDEYMGQHLCIKCGRLKGHILGKFNINDVDRLYYQKKSIYHRKYYFEKKVKNIKILNSEERSELYERLLELDNNYVKIINQKFSRKRMISINYIIKQILKEMGCKKNINLKISSKILEIYDKWWSDYKEMIK